MNDAAHLPVPMQEVKLPEKQTFHLQYNMSHLHRPFFNEAWDDVSSSFDKHSPIALLDDDIWAGEQILDRCLCIHKRPDEPNHQCSYPCPYNSNTTLWMDLLQYMPQNEAVFPYSPMDFSDISSDLPDIMMTTSDIDIHDLDDVSDVVWFA